MTLNLLSSLSQLKTHYPDLFSWIKTHRKELKHFFQRTPDSKVLNVISILDFIMSWQAPLPEGSLALSLFNRGTQLMQLQVFASQKSRSSKKIPQTLSGLGTFIRVAARVMFTCQRFFIRLSLPKEITPLQLTEDLALASQVRSAALTDLADKQNKQLALARKACDAASEQTQVIANLSDLSSENQQDVLELIALIHSLLDDPTTRENLETSVLLRAQIEDRQSSIEQLTKDVQKLEQSIDEELSHMERLKKELTGVLNVKRN